MRTTVQPEAGPILAAAGEHAVDRNEAHGGTLWKFTDTREPLMDGIVDVGMIGTLWGVNMPLQNVTPFTPFAAADRKMIIGIFDEASECQPVLAAGWAGNGMVP